MATATQKAETARACVDCANALKSAKAIIDQTLSHNSALSIDWNSVNAEDIAAVTDATPTEVSNLIGTLAAFNSLLADGHGGNIEKLAKAIA